MIKKTTLSQWLAKAFPLLLCLHILTILSCKTIQPKDHNIAQSSKSNKKELYLPEKIWMVPKENDFNSDQSEFSYKRMFESENIAIFWSKEFGTDLSVNPDPSLQLNIREVSRECERFYNFYVDSLGFVNKGKSMTDKYKLLAFVFKGKENTAFGGGENKKVGIVWTPLARISKAPYGALAHEIGHSFQYLVHADGAWAFTSSAEGSRGQPIFEMTSQYMLWHVYPEWMTFEHYHLESYLKKTHFAFLHETNQYHSPYVLEYWSGKHGLKFIGKLWQQAIKGEDPVMAYKRITRIDQQKFNEQMHQAATKFVTWDLVQAGRASKSYANEHKTTLNRTDSGWLEIDAANCPQNYGYNAIRLKLPGQNAKISLQFKGLAGEKGFRNVNAAYAGWRYSFLAVKEDGKRIYGKIHSSSEGSVSFKVPGGTKFLWLVVSGAPSTHWEHITDGNDENDEQWPYKIKLTGTDLF